MSPGPSRRMSRGRFGSDAGAGRTRLAVTDMECFQRRSAAMQYLLRAKPNREIDLEADRLNDQAWRTPPWDRTRGGSSAAPDHGQRANQDLSSLDDGTAKRGVRPMASVPAVCPSKHRIAAAPQPETRL